jgi:DNA-binding IclR family transcriptional regulator
MGTSSVKSAERTLDVLTYLSGQPSPVLASSISRAVGLPKSSTYHLLNVMRERGFVSYFPDDRLWGVGDTAREIGLGRPKSEGLMRYARPLLKRLANHPDDSALACILHGSDAIVVGRVDGGNPGIGIPSLGVRLPAHLSAYGRALLMDESPEMVRALFPPATPLPGFDGRGPSRRDALFDLLATAARKGFATDRSEWHRSVASVSAPVHDHLGYTVAAVGVSYWPRSRDARAVTELAATVTDAAAELSRLLGSRARASRRDGGVGEGRGAS